MKKHWLRQELREKAQQILAPGWKDTDVERYAHAIFIEDEDGNRDDDPSMKSYCADCINFAVEEYKIKNPKEVKGKTVSYECYEKGESDNFEFCDKCGKPIDVSLLLDEQELEYWEGDPLLDPLHSPARAYELTEILSEDNGYTRRVDRLARRVIKETRYRPSCRQKTATVRWLDFLSPDLDRRDFYGSLSIGVERTFYAMQWLIKTLTYGASSSWHGFSVTGRTWRKDLLRGFQTLLVQQYGRDFHNGDATEVRWDELIDRRAQSLTFDSPQRIKINSVHRWPFEIEEDALTSLLTMFTGKRLTRNPQIDLEDQRGWGCRDRGGWHWEFGQASLCVYGSSFSFHIEYSAPEADGSSWTKRIEQNKEETLFDFLVRVDDTLERYVAPKTQTYQFLYRDRTTYDDEYGQVFFHGDSWEACLSDFRSWLGDDPEDYVEIYPRAERFLSGDGGLGYKELPSDLHPSLDHS